MISRTHFARFLVEAVTQFDLRRVCNEYLGDGKPGYVGLSLVLTD